MRELTAFTYRPGTSLLHCMDVRAKLVLVVLVGLASLNMHPVSLLVVTGILGGLFRASKRSVVSLLSSLRYYGVLLGFVLLARGVNLSLDPPWGWGTVTVDPHGLREGALVCWRLGIVVLAGALFVSTTRSSQMKAAVQWVLAPVPLVPEKRLSFMIALTLRSFPLIFLQAKETAAAQRARGIENRKNPLYRMKTLAVPLLRRTLQDAEKLAVAMEARCYQEDRTDPVLSATRADWRALAAGVGGCVVLLLV